MGTRASKDPALEESTPVDSGRFRALVSSGRSNSTRDDEVARKLARETPFVVLSPRHGLSACTPTGLGLADDEGARAAVQGIDPQHATTTTDDLMLAIEYSSIGWKMVL